MAQKSVRPPAKPAVDPSHSEQTIEMLARQQAFLRQVLDINPNLIFAKDRAGRFTLVNQAIADMYGTTIDELIGKTDADFNPNKDEVAFFRQMDLEVMNSLREKVIPEEPITDALGKVHWLQTVKRPIVGPDGTAQQVLGVATDITERKRLEEQLRQSQKMEALGFLAGGIAHDFNNLLTVVFGNADLIMQRLKDHPSTDNRVVTCLELIIASARRAEALTRQLLAFSRKQPLHPVVLNLNMILTEMGDLLRRIIGEHITFGLQPFSGELFITADPGQIEQVLMNLVVNSRDAMPQGGTLSIDTDVRMLDAEYVAAHPDARLGRHAVLSVADTGVGISADIVGRIFEPFFTTKPVGQGTGLGLSTVYGIVKQAGGHVTVESKVGDGTIVRVHFPLVEKPAAGETDAASPLRDLCGTETVLVCEDQQDVLDLTREILESHGYHVLIAQTGQRALSQATHHTGPIHLIVTDVVMPDMNGRQLAATLRAARPGTKVLFMTGYASNVLGSEVPSDLEWLLTKPFSPTSLLAHVRMALDL